MDSNLKTILNMTGGIAVLGGDGAILHTCLYEGDPGEKEISELKEELRSDPDFDMTAILDDPKTIFRKMTPDEVQSVQMAIMQDAAGQ